VDDQGGAQLVAQPVRAPQLAVAAAAVEVAVGGRAQPGRVPIRPRERRERVHVRARELDLGQAGRRRGGEPVLHDLVGRQVGGRVHRQHADPVEGHRPRQYPRGLQRELPRAAGREPAELAAHALGWCDRHRPSMTPGSWDRRAPFRGAGWYAMVGRAGFLVRLLAAAAVLVGCAAPPADASAAWVAANAIPLRLVERLPDGPDQALAAHHAAQIVAFWEHYSLPAADALVHRDDRGDAGFLDGGSPTQWFDLVVF